MFQEGREEIGGEDNTKSEDNAISEAADFGLKLSMTINDGIGE